MYVNTQEQENWLKRPKFEKSEKQKKCFFHNHMYMSIYMHAHNKEFWFNISE